MSDIFREVSEDVRNQQVKALWDRFGMFVIGAAIALVLGVAGWAFWEDRKSQERGAAAERFLAGEQLLLDGEEEKAAAHFSMLAGDTGITGYRAIAAMKSAAAKAAAGDVAGAVAAYDLLASDSGADELFRGLAALKAAMLLADSASADELRLRLAPLAQGDQPWRFSARELLALTSLREGQALAAAATLRTLADDLEAPRGVRARAAEILQSLPPEIARPIDDNGADAPAE